MASLTMADLERLSRELAALSRAGIPLPEGLRQLSGTIGRGKLSTLTTEVAEAVEKGTPLSEALAQSRVKVPAQLIHLVHCGEKADAVESLLALSAEQARRIRRHRAALTTAFSYPLFVFAAAIGILFFICNAFLPELAGNYIQMGAPGSALPMPTRTIFRVAKVFQGTSGIVLATTLVACGLSMFIPGVRQVIYRGILKLPGMRSLAALSDTTILMRALSSMLARGIPLTEALRTTRLAMWEREFRNSIDKMADAAEQGHTCARFLPSSVPPMAAWLYAEAERRGTLADACKGIGDYCEERFDRVSIQSAAVLEPLLIIFVGIVIGTVVTGGYLPLFGLPRILGW